MTAGLLCLPRTISSSRMTFAGLKKWWPMTCWGRDVAEAIASMSSVEVFEARIASGRVTRSRSAKTRFFNSIPSKTASTTMSASLKPSKVSVGWIRARRWSICCCDRRPFCTEPA
jgi:hypothetical protein